MQHKIREWFCLVRDRFCFWFVGLVAGIHIIFPANSSCEGETVATPGRTISSFNIGDNRETSHRVRANDKRNESPWARERGSNSGWTDHGYFLGDKGMFNYIKEAFRAKGMEYTGDYYDSPELARSGNKAESRAVN